MVNRSVFPLLAENALNSINIGDGDAVLIHGGSHQQEFIEELAIHIVERGGQPFIHMVSDQYMERMFESSTIEQLRAAPGIMKGIAQSLDAYIKVEPYADPSMKARHREKVRAYTEGWQAFSEIVYGTPGKRRLYMGWATPQMAELYGVPLETMERLVIGGATVDYNKIKEECEHIRDMLKDARYVHATDPHGTDLRLMIEGRRISLSDAIWSKEKEAMGYISSNLPTGEVFIPPVETYGEGRLYCPLTVDDLTRGTLIKGAMLEFKDGRLIPEKCTADTNQEVFIDTLYKLADADLKKFGDRNAFKVAEFGIGLNPAIDRAIGYILTDEKIRGSIHVAFGKSDMYGGKTNSHMHWDFVTAPDVTLEVEYRDGSRKMIMDGGKLL